MDLLHPLLGLSAADISPEETPVRSGGSTGRVGYFGMTRTRRLEGELVPKMHKGLDLLAVVGWPVYAMVSGSVRRAGWQNVDKPGKGYGRRFYLDGDITIVYAHLDGLYVVDGDVIPAGTLVGRVGRTGNISKNTPTHLHLEIRVNGSPVDPLKYMAEFDQHGGPAT